MLIIALATDSSYAIIILQDPNIDSILMFTGSIAAKLPCSIECWNAMSSALFVVVVTLPLPLFARPVLIAEYYSSLLRGLGL